VTRIARSWFTPMKKITAVVERLLATEAVWKW
jgi:hypothetical protein